MTESSARGAARVRRIVHVARNQSKASRASLAWGLELELDSTEEFEAVLLGRKPFFRWAGAKVNAPPAGRDLQGPWRCSLLYADNARNVAAFGESRKHQNVQKRHDPDEPQPRTVTWPMRARYILPP